MVELGKMVTIKRANKKKRVFESDTSRTRRFNITRCHTKSETKSVMAMKLITAMLKTGM